VTAQVRGFIGAREDEPVRAIARTERIALIGDLHFAAATVVGADAVWVRRRHQAGATDGHFGRALDAGGVGVVDREGLRAGGAIAASVGGLVGARENELVRTIA